MQGTLVTSAPSRLLSLAIQDTRYKRQAQADLLITDPSTCHTRKKAPPRKWHPKSTAKRPRPPSSAYVHLLQLRTQSNNPNSTSIPTPSSPTASQPSNPTPTAPNPSTSPPPATRNSENPSYPTSPNPTNTSHPTSRKPIPSATAHSPPSTPSSHM